MIKKLLFTAALLAPSLAYGQNPSADLSVQVTPAAPPNSIACDIGPAYTGTIPAPAQAAGYTHCAANYDFSNSSAYSNANISTWFRCPDDGAGGTQWYRTSTGGNPAPCADTHIITDTDGMNTLDETFTPTDFNNNVGNVEMWTQSAVNEPNTAGTSFPSGAYFENVTKVPPSTFTSLAYVIHPGAGLLIGGPWLYGQNAQTLGQNIMEWDFNEIYSNNTQANFGEHCPTNFGCKSFPTVAQVSDAPGFNSTGYNTYGLRVTQDTSGNVAACVYLNGSPIPANSRGTSCISTRYINGGSDTVINQRGNLITWAGAQGPGQQCGNIPCQTPSGNVDVYYRRITVWTCASWRTTGCTGTVLTTP